MARKKFDECIRELRALGRIPLVWSASDLLPFLKDDFARQTISVYPNNFSVSPDGLIKGDAVKKGMKPKYYRLGRGRFILIEEYDADLDGKLQDNQIRQRSAPTRSINLILMKGRF